MTRSGAPGRRRFGPVALAGWLFADLLLVLTLVALSDRADPQAARPHPSASRSVPPTPAASPSPTGPRSLDRARKTFTVSGRNEKKLVDQLRSKTARWDGREAALVQTFGGGRGGTHYAHRVNSLLHRARAGMFPKTTLTDDFLKLGRKESTAEVWIYFYTS